MLTGRWYSHTLGHLTGYQLTVSPMATTLTKKEVMFKCSVWPGGRRSDCSLARRRLPRRACSRGSRSACSPTRPGRTLHLRPVSRSFCCLTATANRGSSIPVPRVSPPHRTGSPPCPQGLLRYLSALLTTRFAKRATRYPAELISGINRGHQIDVNPAPRTLTPGTMRPGIR